MAFFTINGVAVPCPAKGLNLERQQLVDSKRNALGEVVAQKINKRLSKFSTLEWKHLSADDWRTIQKLVDEFTVWVRYWDNPSGEMLIREFYFGDESSEIWKIDNDTGHVLEYINCKVNLIDTGKN